jgi:hypothetical protein
MYLDRCRSQTPHCQKSRVMKTVLCVFSKVWAWIKTIPAHIWFIGISIAAWLSYRKALRWQKRARIERDRAEAERAYRESLERLENLRQTQRNMIFDKHKRELAHIKAREKVLSNAALDKKKLAEHLNSVFGEDE